MLKTFIRQPLIMVFAVGLAACAVESQTALTPQKTMASKQVYNGPKVKVALGEFENRTNYMRGVFSNGGDMLGTQARTIVKTHLQESRRFSVLDRRNINSLAREADLAGTNQRLAGASYIVTGDVVEFGKKNVGDKQFFGILGKGKAQVAYAKVNLLLVNTTTSEVVYTAQGAGEVALSNREVLGFGGTAGYDSTLNGKVLNLAIREAVDDLVRNLVL